MYIGTPWSSWTTREKGTHRTKGVMHMLTCLMAVLNVFLVRDHLEQLVLRDHQASLVKRYEVVIDSHSYCNALLNVYRDLMDYKVYLVIKEALVTP